MEVLGLNIRSNQKNIIIGIGFLLIFQGVLVLGFHGYKVNKLLKQDTVMSGSNIKPSKVKRIEEINPLGWLDEENIIIKKGHPLNIYKYNLKTGEECLLIASEKDISYAAVSPNRRYIFYVEGSELTGTGYIYNLTTNKAIQVTELDEIPLGIGRWTDDKSVIFFSYTKGGVFVAGLDGRREQIAPKAQGLMRDPIRVGDKIYYVSDEYKLYKYDILTKETKLLLQETAEFIPSRDGSNFAKVSLGRKSLDITDENGERRLQIYHGVGVGGFSWSPCGNKLAYLVSSDSGKGEQLYIAQISSGKSVKVADNIPQSFPYIFWSPSGKKILVPAYEKNDDKQKFAAIIIEIE